MSRPHRHACRRDCRHDRARRTCKCLAGAYRPFAALGYIKAPPIRSLHAAMPRRSYLARASLSPMFGNRFSVYLPHPRSRRYAPNQIALVLHALPWRPFSIGLPRRKHLMVSSGIFLPWRTPAVREIAVRLAVAIFLPAGIFAASTALTLSHAFQCHRPRLTAAPSSSCQAPFAAGMLDKLDTRRIGMIMTAVAMFSACALFILMGNVGIRASATVFYLGSGVFVVFFTTTYMKLSAHMRMHEPAEHGPCAQQHRLDARERACHCPGQRLLATLWHDNCHSRPARRRRCIASSFQELEQIGCENPHENP